MASRYLPALFAIGLVVLSASAAPTPPDDGAVDTSNEVSWQSAFWALLPIALNSMTQPTGKVLGIPSKYSFYLNSSPIVCLTNALEIVSNICWRSYALSSVDAAARLTAKDLFKDDESPEQPNHSGLAQLQEIKTVRLFVFILGALPQVIKLYAMKGIAGTKIWASMYLGSFLIIEATMRWLEKYRTDTRRRNDPAECAYDYGNRIEIFILSLSRTTALIIIATIGSITSNWVLGCLSLFIGVVLSITVTYIHLFEPPDYYSSSPSGVEQILTVSLLPSLCAALLSGMPAWLGLPSLDGIGTVLRITYTMMAPAVLMGFLYVCTRVEFMMERWDKSSQTLYEGLPLFFMLFQLFAGIQWYAYVYDPEGTYKPAWTNQLG